MKATFGQRPFSFARVAFLAALVPLAVAAIYVAAVRLANLDRFDPAYFTPDLVQEYNTPGHVAGELAVALQNNDAAKLAVLEGLRRPVSFPTGGDLTVALIRPMDKSTYVKALIADAASKDYAVYRIGKIQGRWVVSPEDAFYAVDSGVWAATFLPIALAWWMVEIAATLMVGISLTLKRWKRERGGLHSPGYGEIK